MRMKTLLAFVAAVLVLSAPMAFDQSISQGDTVKVTFATAGTYKYHCSIHASMHGTIIVTS